MLSTSDNIDGDNFFTLQNPSHVEDTSPNTLALTTSSYACPVLFCPTFFYQSTEPLPMENIFRRLRMPLSENGAFQCSARVNEAVRDMMEPTNTGIRAIPPPNGVFTLFGSSIVLTPPPDFNCHSGEFQFHSNSDFLHPVPNPNLQTQPGPAVPSIFPPPNHGPGAGPSSSCFPQSLASCRHCTEPLMSSGSPLLIEPLASGPSFREPVVSGPRLPVGFPPGFRSLPPLPSSSHDLPPANLRQTCHLSRPEAIASGSQVPEPLPPGYRLPDALPADFPLPDPKGKGKMNLINEAAQRRQIRMNKNRASASRSRARRRAYEAELEREIQYLTEENERIRRETAEMRFEAAEQEATRKRWFGRAPSPPF